MTIDGLSPDTDDHYVWGGGQRLLSAGDAVTIRLVGAAPEPPVAADLPQRRRDLRAALRTARRRYRQMGRAMRQEHRRSRAAALVCAALAVIAIATWRRAVGYDSAWMWAIGIVAGAIASALSARVTRRARPARAGVESEVDKVIEYSLGDRVFGTILYGGFAVAALHLTLTTAAAVVVDVPAWATFVLLASLALLATYQLLERLLSQIELRQDGLISRTPWRSRFIKWTSVDAVSWYGDYFSLLAADWQVVSISTRMVGIPHLFESLKNVPPTVWADAVERYQSGGEPQSPRWRRIGLAAAARRRQSIQPPPTTRSPS